MSRFKHMDSLGTPESPARKPQAPAMHPHHRVCRAQQCGERVDANDGLCGRHRALQAGPLEVIRWEQAREDWRARAFATFTERHKDDAWGAAIRVAGDMGQASREEKRELVAFLRLQVQKNSTSADR